SPERSPVHVGGAPGIRTHSTRPACQLLRFSHRHGRLPEKWQHTHFVVKIAIITSLDRRRTQSMWEISAQMKQSVGYVAVVVRDYDEAIKFYVDTLGFDLVEDTYIEAQDNRWVLVAPPGSTGTRVLLAR